MTAGRARFCSALAALMLVLAGAAHARATDLVVYTEEFPPYNYTARDGHVAGSATDNVRIVLDAAGLSYTIRVVPWPRAMRAALDDKNALIYTIARTPTRQDRFDWLAPLFYSEFYVFARTDDPRPVTLAALQAGKFRASCIAADVTCELLDYLKIPKRMITVMPNEGPLDLQLVMAGRADIYIHDRAANDEDMKRLHVPVSAVRRALKVDYNGGFYLAAGMQVPAAIRDRIRTTCAALMKAGRYHIIPDPPMPQ